MDDLSDSLGYEADRTLPVEMSRPTGSYASECRERARLIQKTCCDPKRFLEVVSGLPSHKVEAVNNIGMGHLQHMKLNVMHYPMWTHVVNKVDLKNRSVKIWNVDCNINVGQYTRLTGIRDGGSIVELRTAEKGTSLMTSDYCDSEGNLVIEGLIFIIRNRNAADELFQIAYALFALTTILCPGLDDTVDSTLLASLEYACKIRDKNWASFAVERIFEGVARYRRGETEYVTGSVIFFQLLYLDVVGQGFGIIHKDIVPIAAWTTEDLNLVSKGIRQRGGFSAPLVVLEPTNAANIRLVQEEGHSPGRIGIQRSLHEDIYETKSGMNRVTETILSLTQMLEEHIPDCRELTQICGILSQERDQLEQICVTRVISELQEAALHGKSNADKRKRDAGVTKTPLGNREADKNKRQQVPRHQQITPLGHVDKPHCARRLNLNADKGAAMPSNNCQPVSETSSSPVGYPAQLNLKSALKRQCMTTKVAVPRAHVRVMHNNELYGATFMPKHKEVQNVNNNFVRKTMFAAGPYMLHRPLPQTDVRLINYALMWGKHPTEADNKSSLAVCGEGRESLLRHMIMCLAPSTSLNMEVINFVCEFMTRDNPNAWYLPTYFTSQANEKRGDEDDYVDVIIRTRSVCNLFRFDGRVDTCELIFIPLHVSKSEGHWWLLVIDIKKRLAQIWDSFPAFTTEKESREIAENALRHINETINMTSTTTGNYCYHPFERFDIVFPPNAPKQTGDSECGMFLIQHILFYGTMWWNQYQLDEQRASLLLQCLKAPASEIHEEVRQRADDYHFGRTPSLIRVEEEATAHDDDVPVD